jgi:hypothetical protein
MLLGIIYITIALACSESKTEKIYKNAVLAISDKVFPKLKRKGSSRFATEQEEDIIVKEVVVVEAEKNATDFVFRIVYPNYVRTFPQGTTIKMQLTWFVLKYIFFNVYR